MKRWRIDGFAGRCLVTAALAVLLIGGWPHEIPGVRWDRAAGAFFFVDPKDDMFVVFMMQAPLEGGRIQLALKTLIYEALKE
jgi:CubicO group peptidase (beta-lactamase class C family)